MKRLFSIIMLVLWSLAVSAQYTFTADDLLYSVNDDGASVTVLGHVDGTEAMGPIVIPNTVSYNGSTYPVTVIGEYAFAGELKSPGSLTIGNNVTHIGYGAFASNDSLTGHLVIPNSVVHIGHHAFADCDGFTGDLTIPNSVDTIGLCAFAQCSGFDGTLTIGSSVSYIWKSAFQLCCDFTKAVCLAQEPPVLEPTNGTYPHPGVVYYQFYGIGCSTIIVPCGSKEAYEASPWHGANCFEVIIQDCEDVGEFEETTALVYPNPTKGLLTLSGETMKKVEIINLLGQTMIQSDCDGDAITIDVSSLKAGVYVLHICLANGMELSEKIVKE